MKDVETLAKKAVKKIIEDLSDRRGLRQAWEGIDEDIRDEIVDVWQTIIVGVFEKSS